MLEAGLRRAFWMSFGVFLLLMFQGPVRAGDAAERTQYFQGKIVSLAGTLAKAGVQLDSDAAPHWMALVTDDGKIYPLVKDDGSRMFFRDTRLLNRPMRLTGRLIPGSQLLQVVQVHSQIKGELHEVYYWCDICSIKRFQKQDCDCCGAAMELRETPVKK
jgi:hypothetical protein